MKISVVIVTRNRREDVFDTIHGYNRQTWKDKEIIVIDNASDDGTREMMENDFPEIKYVYLPDNFDIRSINIGVEMAEGEIIWRTDSDSYPEDPGTFAKVIDIFNKYQNIDIISTEDVEVNSNGAIWEWYPLKVDKENVPDNGYKAHIFPGTGAAIRKKVFDKIGGFWEFGFEEIDFCTRAIVAGFNVRYFPNIRTLHFASPRDRDNSNRWVQISKQLMRYNWRYFPFFTALGRSIVIYITQILGSFSMKVKLSAFIEGLLIMPAVIFSTYRNERNVVPKDKIKDITLGVGIMSSQFKVYADKVKRKLQKWTGR